MPSQVPLFSIVIPTRNRAHLLPFALRSALEQDFDDYEIVVVANDCADRTRDVVREMQDDRVRYLETPTMLSMPDNWDYAWTKARGTYVTYLSDDDALVPSALSVLTKRALDGSPAVVSWEDAVYYYPDWHDPQLRNLLLLFFQSGTLIEDVSTERYRKLCARFEFPWQWTLPKMLNCVAHRESLDAWRDKLGRLFPPICPDYSFGWIVSHAFDSIRVVHRPLSVRGISDHSIGSNAGLGDAGKGFMREFGDVDFFAGMPTRVPATMNLLAATFLRTNAMLAEQAVAHEELDQGAYLLAVAKQLRERESEALLADPSEYFPELLAAAATVSDELRASVNEILTAPSAPTTTTESIRDVRRRTARMALEYEPTLANTIDDHLGDESCARCVLGLADGALAGPTWDSLYVLGEEIGVSDPHGASTHVDRFYDLLLRCRDKRGRAAARAGIRVPRGGRIPQNLADQLREKERVIADLRATADERLRLVEDAHADAAHARQMAEQLVGQLQERDQLIADLSASADERLGLIATLTASADERLALIASLQASADERLGLVEQAHAGAAQARDAAEQLVAQLHEKGRLIADLTASADERPRLVEDAHAEAAHARRMAEQLAQQLQERDRLIATLTASADERLGLMEAAHADAAQARDAAEQLVAQLHEKDRLIAELAASADERLRLLNEATEAAARERATSEALAAQLRMKEQAIEELTIAAEARLQLAQDASAEAQQARARAERLALELDEKEQVISGLVDAAAERLSVIERLSQAAPRANS